MSRQPSTSAPAADPPRAAPGDRAAPLPSGRTVSNRLLAVLAVVAVLWALKWSAPVSMPVAFAGFIIAVAWPIKRRLDRILPSMLSYVGTVIALFIVLGVFIGGLYLTVQSIVSKAPQYGDEVQQTIEHVRSWLQQRDLPVPGGGDGAMGSQRIMDFARAVVGMVYSGLGTFFLIVSFVIVGLPAVPFVHRKLEERIDTDDRHPAQIVKTIGVQFQYYVGVTTLTSLITGILTGLYALVLGLDFALLWGVIGFLLNYIPTIGSVIAVIPPTLFAFLQFGGLLMPLAVLVGLSAIQLIMGAIIYPKVQGRSLSLLPITVLVSLTLWGWIWGIPGALLAVPLTTTAMITFAQFPSSRWFAELIGDPGGPRDNG
jgi:predicted PurR-regulated permease PerM